jgi:MFS family permease
MGAWVGTVVVGPVADRYYPRRFKRLLLQLFVMQVVLFGLFMLSLPVGGRASAVLPASGASLMGLVCIASVFLGATTPIMIELGAEVTFPASEGVSAGLVSAVLNLSALVFLALLAYIPTSHLSGLVVATCTLCGLCLLPVREHYLRSDYDDRHETKAG